MRPLAGPNEANGDGGASVHSGSDEASAKARKAESIMSLPDIVMIHPIVEMIDGSKGLTNP